MNKIMKFIKRPSAGLLALALGLCATAVFAEGGTAIDTTAATTALSDMSTAVKSFITSAIPYIVGILGVALSATLVWVAWKWIKKGSNKAG